jgi:serine/threonine-protein kinase HipA
MFDVVTTSIYKYAQSPGGPLLEDRTLALKLYAGRHQTKAYPTTEELLDFGRKICGVADPARALERIAQAMKETIEEAKGDPRVPKDTLAQMKPVWELGYVYAK